MSKGKKEKSRKSVAAISICFAIALIIVLIYILFPGNSEIEVNEVENTPNIKILVRNGCGVSGLAQSVSQSLLCNNITVVDWENISNQSCVYEETMLVIRQELDKEQEYKLHYLQEKTGIKKVTKAVKANAKAEFELILGKDYVLYF
ncbi:MAG: LytR C-terminal domain-containing protein [Candidatus Cloacimonetes bacterium]|nr:LytR C-terminal domain-containing protein [Candidatus Cloacimonadota bacterium]